MPKALALIAHNLEGIYSVVFDNWSCSGSTQWTAVLTGVVLYFDFLVQGQSVQIQSSLLLRTCDASITPSLLLHLSNENRSVVRVVVQPCNSVVVLDLSTSRSSK